MKLVAPLLTTALVLTSTVAVLPASAAGDETSATPPAGPLQLAQNEDRRERRGVPPGLEEAAETLGVTVRELLQALRNSGGPPPDLEKAAATLGITVEELRSALPERRRRQN